MKKTMKMLGILLVCILLAGCGGDGQQPEKLKEIRIGVSVYDQFDVFISELLESMESYAKEMEERYDITVSLEILNAGANQLTQNDQMEYFLEQECDIVCINLVDRTDASTIIERGKSADVPIIFFNRELVEEDLERWEKLYYVGAEAFESGVLQGELLIEKLETDFESVDKNGDGILQYVMLEGEAGHQDTIIRTMYVLDTVTEAGYPLEKLGDEIANWSRDQGKTKMVQWLDAYGDEIEGVFSNNDAMALGAVDALKAAGFYIDSEKQAPVILGIDGTRDALAAVKKGVLLGTVTNDGVGQSRAILELAYSIISGESLIEDITLLEGKYIRLPYEKVSGESLKEKTDEK